MLELEIIFILKENVYDSRLSLIMAFLKFKQGHNLVN